jgi:hypothetical protein
MTPDEVVVPSLGGQQYEWGSNPYVDQIISSFPVDEWPLIMQEWWSWALHYTEGFFQPLITSVIICCSIKAESGGDRYKRSGYVNQYGTREDSVGLFQMYRFGAGAPYVPELNSGTDLRENPKVQFDVMVPKFRDRFITSWNLGLREGALCRDVCGHVEGSDPAYWDGYKNAWDTLTANLPWAGYLRDGF